MIQFVTLYVAVLTITTVLALGVAFGAWLQRESSSAWPAVVLMLGVSAWCGTEAAMWSSTSLAQQALWLRLTYPAVSMTVVGTTIFALDIAEICSWLTPRRIGIIALPHVMVCVLALTNPGGLFYAGFTAQQIGSHTHYVAQNGPLFWLFILVAYGMLVMAFGVMVRASIKSTPAKRVQTLIVLAGTVIPFVVSVANQLSPVQLEGIESTAFFFTGVVFLFALMRGRLLDPHGRFVTAQRVLESEHRERELTSANRQLGSELQATRHRADRLYDQATHDPLTNLSNRRALEEDLVREMARSRRTGDPIAFLLFDLDDFKPVNDTFSHLAGDAALKMVSEVLLRGSRQEDIMCRWGGDEFLVVMPGANMEIAYRRAEELREEIAHTHMLFEGSEFSITASIGVSVLAADGETSQLAILAADRALYSAKGAGGNRTAIADDLERGGSAEQAR